MDGATVMGGDAEGGAQQQQVGEDEEELLLRGVMHVYIHCDEYAGREGGRIDTCFSCFLLTRAPCCCRCSRQKTYSELTNLQAYSYTAGCSMLSATCPGDSDLDGRFWLLPLCMARCLYRAVQLCQGS